ncbi:MAG: phasin family protein [Desulfobacterales bacterium]|nr:phasin family protein [Desulfobacterales bacterium]MBF0397136.1 phasin family protein [Desulfobacterales bacterium]
MAEAASEKKTDYNFFIVKALQKATETITSAFKEYNEKYIAKIEDTISIVEGFKELGKKFIDNISILEKIEEKISTTITSVVNQMNLSTKQDVDKLTKAMDELRKKVEELGKS